MKSERVFESYKCILRAYICVHFVQIYMKNECIFIISIHAVRVMAFFYIDGIKSAKKNELYSIVAGINYRILNQFKTERINQYL